MNTPEMKSAAAQNEAAYQAGKDAKAKELKTLAATWRRNAEKAPAQLAVGLIIAADQLEAILSRTEHE